MDFINKSLFRICLYAHKVFLFKMNFNIEGLIKYKISRGDNITIPVSGKKNMRNNIYRIITNLLTFGYVLKIFNDLVNKQLKY